MIAIARVDELVARVEHAPSALVISVTTNLRVPSTHDVDLVRSEHGRRAADVLDELQHVRRRQRRSPRHFELCGLDRHITDADEGARIRTVTAFSMSETTKPL